MAFFDVLLPVKNGKPYFAASIESIRSQTFSDWRLIILDHGSSDGSLELANQYAAQDKRIVVYSFPRAQGLSGLLNCGLDGCDSKYVLRQDADDISMPDRMQVIADAFDANKDMTLVGSQGDMINAKGRITGRFDMPTGPQGVVSGTLFRIPVAHPAAAMRLEGLHRLGARYGVDFISVVAEDRRLNVAGLAEDYFLFGQLALVANCMNLDRRLIQLRWHGANVSAKNFFAQTQVALNISRYLAESLSIMYELPRFDPAPFCNHGSKLFKINEKRNFTDEFHAMEQALLKAFPASADLLRELAFRKVVANRGRLAMAAHFCNFAASHGARPAEFHTVKSWLASVVRANGTLNLSDIGLSE